MNNELSIFHFESSEVRVVLIENEPFFCLTDVLFAIKSGTTPSNAKSSIVEFLGDEYVYLLNTDQSLNNNMVGNQLLFINEPAVTFLVSRSRTELGKQLNRWIHSEILPQIRKTGQYSVNEAKENLEKQFLPDRTLKELKEYLELSQSVYGEAYKQRLFPIVIKKYYPDLPVIEPSTEEKASLPAEALLTPTQIAQELGIFYSTGNPNPRKVNELLAQLGYQEKIGGQWSATAKAKELCDRKPVDTNSRSQKDQLMWTRKIIDILKEHSLR